MLQPIFDNVLVIIEGKQETTEAGLVIPDNASFDRPQKGKVIAAGPDCKIVKEGDEVIFKKYSPDEVKIGEETFHLLVESDVMALVK